MRRILSIALIVSLMVSGIVFANAEKLNELKVAPRMGIADTINLVNQLDNLQKVLYIGAHPDDESNSLLVYLNRKLGADSIYAVQNWGEGGDNSIGKELYGALGALRSQELKSSRSFDGSKQMYLGGYDFGYSVSLKESLLGDEETNSEGIYIIDILGYNFAKLLRQVRPDVVFSSHKAPSTDHGQHRATGWLVEYGIDLAAREDYVIHDDEGNELAPFQVKKFFGRPYSERQVTAYDGQITSAGLESSQNPVNADLRIDLGEYDPILGMSYNEWGVIGRNMHKGQKMISAPVKGESISNHILKKAAPGASIDESFSSTVFGGIDILTIPDLSKIFGELPEITELANSIQSFQDEFDIKDPTAGGDYLARAMTALGKLQSAVENLEGDREQANARSFLDTVHQHIFNVVKNIYAMDVDITANAKDAVPGQTLTVTATLWARGASADMAGIPAAAMMDEKPTAIQTPEGWAVKEVSATDQMSAGEVVGRTFVYEVSVPEDYTAYTGPFNGPYNESYTNPYYPNGRMLNDKQRVALSQDSQDPAVTVPEMVTQQNNEEDLGFGITTSLTDPYAHSPVVGVFNALIGGQTYQITNVPDLRIVPKLSVLVSNPANMLKFTGEQVETTINVVVRNNMQERAEGITLTARTAEDSGITFSEETVTVEPQSVLSANITVKVPETFSNSGADLVVEATYEGETFSEGYQAINYSHIDTVNYYEKAIQKLSVIEYGLPDDNIRIGFLKTGYDDYIFDYIKAMYSDPAKAEANLKELSVTDITRSGAQLASQYDTIIIGKTALPDQSPVATDLRSSFTNLIDFANNGGNLVLHYQNYHPDNIMSFAPVPFPMEYANINKEDGDVFVNSDAAATDFFRGIDLELDGEKSLSSIWEGWNQQRAEWTPGLAAEGAVEAMEDLGYTVLFEGQDPEGTMRPAILYMEMENGGHFTYSAVVWERQLQNLVPGAYRLYANLISIGYNP